MLSKTKIKNTTFNFGLPPSLQLSDLSSSDDDQDIFTSTSMDRYYSFHSADMLSSITDDNTPFHSTPVKSEHGVYTYLELSPDDFFADEVIIEKAQVKSPDNSMDNYFPDDDALFISKRAYALTDSQLYADGIHNISDDSDDSDDAPENDSSSSIPTTIPEPPEKQARFSVVATNDEILRRMVQNVPQKTRYQNSWATSAWRDWAEWRNSTADPTLLAAPFKIAPIDPQDATEQELGFWLSRFVLEVRNAKGKPYPPTSLHNLLCGIQRHFNTRADGEHRNVKIFNKDNRNFHKFYESCDSVMRNLTSEGYGQDVKQADPITAEDEEALWSTNTISLDTAKGLLFGVYFYNVRSFALRGGKIHRDLEKEQFKIDIDLETGVEVLRYHERLSKGNQQGLRHLKVKFTLF